MKNSFSFLILHFSFLIFHFSFSMSNSPFVSFLRSAMMFAMLVTILLIAVFWNGLPEMKSEGNLLPVSWKSFFQQDEAKPDQEPHRENFTPSKQSEEKDSNVSTGSISLEMDTSNEIPNEPQRNIEEVPSAAMETNLPENFTLLKKTLEQEYGATEILLEPWGSEGKMYRFSCYISQPKGSGVKKLHQSIQPTPVLAIQKVMESVR